MPDGTASAAQVVLQPIEAYIPPMLTGAIFVGHTATDLDSIAGSIGAAELYGGVAARASEINAETEFALMKWGVEQPPKIEDVVRELPERQICLVDFQQTSQMNSAIDDLIVAWRNFPSCRSNMLVVELVSMKPEKVCGIIDHHALQSSTIAISRPIHVDIRPWGSMSTILAHTFLSLGLSAKRSTAGLLLGAILSDSLDLKGPTTTEWDRKMVDVLANAVGMSQADVREMAKGQFKAKSAELAALPASELVGMDQKSFKFDTPKFKGAIGFAVLETVDPEPLLARAADLLAEVRKDKANKGYAALMLAVVDIVNLNSTLLLADDVEKSLAVAAFSPQAEVASIGETMELPGLVSRKKDFVSAVDRAVKAGWSC